jgi:hypothetical protein
VLISAFVGLGFGAVSYPLSGRHSYRSVSGVQAARYDVVADADTADDLLRRTAANRDLSGNRSTARRWPEGRPRTEIRDITGPADATVRGCG